MSRQLTPFPIAPPEAGEADPAAEQFAAHAAAHQMSRQHRGRTITVAAVVAVLVLAAGSITAYMMLRHQPAAQHPAGSALQAGPAPSGTTDSGTASYVSDGQDLNLSFTYPAGWTATPASGGNADDQAITLTSPLVSIPAASGTAVTGKVAVSIRPGTAQLSELASGSATAAQASVQFAYATPTTSQHQYPYLTFVHLAGGADPNGAFDEVIITGITPFTAGQGITADSLGQLDPIISARFYQCAAEDCTGASATPLSVTNATWQTVTALQQTQAIFQSLRLN